MNTYYATHYFNFKNIGVYLLASLLGLIIVITIVLCIAKLQMHKKLQDDSLTTRKIRRLNREHQAKELTIIESSCSLCVLGKIPGFIVVAVSLLLCHPKWMA